MNKQRVARFATIGVINTALDFGLLFLLTHLGLNPIVANYISTGTAFIFSFFANRNITFKGSSGKIHHQIALFFIVTFIGLWIWQPLIILGVDKLLANSGYSDGVTLLIGKLVASVFTLVWNYVLYARLVFKTKK